MYKKILDRDLLKGKQDGVAFFKPAFFVIGSVNVFLYSFQQFMN